MKGSLHWEYETAVKGKEDSDGLQKFFAEAGRRGWELCGIIPTYPESGSFTVIFKRPRLDAAGNPVLRMPI